jgi:DNA-binding IclR family transcriptional regulator
LGALPDAATSAPGAVGAVDRALAVLCAFSRESPSLGITEISARLGLTKSTVHRLLQTLAARGMVAQDPARRSYTLGYRVLALAQAVPGEATLRQICLPHMQWLRSITQETIGLYVVAGDVRMCLDEIESPQVLRMAAGLGRCFPLASGAPSKALLADGPASGDLWRRAVASLPDDHRTQLIREVDELRRRGFASSTGETVPGSASVAAPLRGADGAIIAALSVAGPASRFDTQAIARHGAILLQGIARITRDLVTAFTPAQASAR